MSAMEGRVPAKYVSVYFIAMKRPHILGEDSLQFPRFVGQFQTGILVAQQRLQFPRFLRGEGGEEEPPIPADETEEVVSDLLLAPAGVVGVLVEAEIAGSLDAEGLEGMVAKDDFPVGEVEEGVEGGEDACPGVSVGRIAGIEFHGFCSGERGERIP